ncbi:MAG: STAS domain-containing protein [Acidobacteria bacterium]|nr:STAS domain-containing protein [Acidobacteriota bacterium]
MPLDVERSDLDSGVVVLSLSGRLTMGNQLQHFEWTVTDLVKEQKNKIVLDLSGVDHLDSSGIGVLVNCNAVVRNAGGHLRLAGVADRVQALFKMTGVNDLLKTDATREDAISALSGNS